MMAIFKNAEGETVKRCTALVKATHTMLLLIAGTNPKSASERLGHSSVTLRHLQPCATGYAARVSKLNAVLFSDDAVEKRAYN